MCLTTGATRFPERRRRESSGGEGADIERNLAWHCLDTMPNMNLHLGHIDWRRLELPRRAPFSKFRETVPAQCWLR